MAEIPPPAENDTVEGAGSLRVNLTLLDTLMNLAGELVLSRNQLLQGISGSNMKAIETSGQRIDMITSELQDAIMRTRMQPIATVFNRFNRQVRDLCRDLDKSVELDVRGKEVELDKTILEAISTPLALLVETAVRNDIETPADREAAGKGRTGTLSLNAVHEAGQVTITLADDGRGLPLEEDVKSVVSAGIEGMGGTVDMEARAGAGTEVRIQLPLTLAIIPCQITSVGRETYAVPQANLSELLRIPAAEVKEKIEKVGDADVVRLRGELLPLLDLSSLLGIPRIFREPETGESVPERRLNIADRRSPRHRMDANGRVTPITAPKQDHQEREPADRRQNPAGAVHIAVVSAGTFKYGLVVDRFHDAEEIVVKPVGRHLAACTAYAGATIMGDGKVALILDILNIAQTAGLSAVSEAAQMAKTAEETAEAGKNRESLLTFRNAETENFAAPLEYVQRIERIRTADIEAVGGRKVIQYRGGALGLLELSQVMDAAPLPDTSFREVIVFKVDGREFGLLVTPPVDALDVIMEMDETTLRQTVIKGSMVINNNTTLLVDIDELSAHS